MKPSAFLAPIGAIYLTLLSLPANAQTSRTWVSGVGDDTNACSRTAPCKTFAGAFAKTVTGGEINCLDPGGFGAVNITKSITIDCAGTLGSIQIGSGLAFIINAPDAVVTLRNLLINGLGSATSTGFSGIRLTTPGTLVIENVRIFGFSRLGLEIAHASGQAKVFVSDSYITSTGTMSGDAGIKVRPTGGGACNISVSRVQILKNLNGIFMDGSGGAGACNLLVDNSNLAGNLVNGIAVASAAGPLVATVTNSTISSNANVGAAVANAAATLRLGGNTISSNVVGVSNAGGTLQSFKDNRIAGNLTDGTPIVAFPGPGGAALQ